MDSIVNEHYGSCLCGHCTYRVAGEPVQIVVCSCLDCQHRTGSAFGIGVWFHLNQVISLPKDIVHYKHFNENGRWVEHGFCSKCGSTLSWQAEMFNQQIAFAGGTFHSKHLDSKVDHFVYKKTLPKWVRFQIGE